MEPLFGGSKENCFPIPGYLLFFPCTCGRAPKAISTQNNSDALQHGRQEQGKNERYRKTFPAIIALQDCLIQGRTDYIYGSGTAYFQGCEIRSWGGGWITAPATAKDQPFGFVFRECRLTYADNSPRPSDDGAKIALGRPWHNYPKVAWLNCTMTDMIDPLGWPDKWRMEYSDTSTDLHLYEYNNSGGGAAMHNRNDWAGLRALTDEEALQYRVSNVLRGGDGWNPVLEASVRLKR